MVELHDKQKQREETGLKGNIVDQLKPTSKITGNSNLYTSDAYHPTKKEMGRLVNLYSQGNFHEALIEGHVLVGKFPDNFIILNIIGAVYTGLNRYCKAIVSYKKAIELKPNFAEAYSNLGNTLNHLGKYQEAIISYKKAIELKANFAEVHYNLGEVLKRLGKLEEAIISYKKAIEIKLDYVKAYNNLGNVFNDLDNYQEAISSYNKAIELRPGYAEAYNNLGNALIGLGKSDEAIINYKKAIHIKINHAEAHYNLGKVLKRIGRAEEAINNYGKAIELKPDFSEAYNNLGNAFSVFGKSKAEAINNYKKAMVLRPDYAEAYWNRYGLSQNTIDAIYTLSKALVANPSHPKSLITRAGLKSVMGSTADFHVLGYTKFSDHAYKRSFDWFFKLKETPKIYFDRWNLFNDMIDLADRSRPFYEYGVWMGISFEYLINAFDKGFGFDTFSGLPEDWHHEKAGTYSSKGVVPRIEGGEFIVGKFEETLPIFFSEKRPKASIINFDADLYSSTICALRNSKNIIDDKTILIFDEFIMNDHWEQDEYKALNDFCAEFKLKYQVLAVSFFTKQVAVKITK